MSDFLASLAARVRPVAPPIEPRRASVFESRPIESTAAAPAPEEAREKTPTATSRYESTSNEVATAHRAEPAQIVRPTSAEYSPVPHASTALPVSTTHVTHVVHGSGERIATEKLISAAASPIVPPSPLTWAPPPPSSQPAATRAVVTEKIVLPPNPAAVPAPTEPRSALPPPAPAFAPPTVRLIEPALHAPVSLHSAPPMAVEPPAIRVTIGRVEVRAVLPAAPTPQPTAPARRPNPVISLDDYLKLPSSRSARS